MGPNQQRLPPRAGLVHPQPRPSTAPIATGTGTKIGTINIEQAVVGTNEGQRDFEALQQEA